MSNMFEIFRGKDGGYYFRLVSSNGSIILKSEKYSSIENARKGVQSVKHNAPKSSKYEKRETKDGKHYFVLKAENGKIVGVSNFFASRTGREFSISNMLQNTKKAKVLNRDLSQVNSQ